MSEKLTELTEVSSLDNTSLFYVVDPTRAAGDKDVAISKTNLANEIGGGSGGGVQTFSNKAAFRAITSAPEDIVYLEGNNTLNDGGQGFFQWNASSTATDDNGITLKATAIATGRAERIYSGAVDIKWLDAIGDNLQASAETNFTAIQAAVNASNGELKLGDSITETFIVSQPVQLKEDTTYTVNAKFTTKNGSEVLLTADANVNDTTITVADASVFAIGQQIVLTDDNQPVNGGNPLQTRRIGYGYLIDGIAGNVITLNNPVTTLCEVSANAKIGHYQSVFVGYDDANITITGYGIIDQNKANQLDSVPIRTASPFVEDTTFGTAMGFDNCDNITIEGVTVQNAILHNLGVKNSTGVYIRRIKSLNAHDKNIIVWFCNEGNINDIRSDGSEFEDGLSLYSNNSDIKVSNIYAFNNSRSGVAIAGSGSNITFTNITSEQCRKAFSISDSTDIHGRFIVSKNCGIEFATNTPRENFTIDSTTDSTFHLIARDTPDTDNILYVLGTSDNLNFQLDFIGARNTGTGQHYGVNISSEPTNISFTNSVITGLRGGRYGYRYSQGVNADGSSSPFVSQTGLVEVNYRLNATSINNFPRILGGASSNNWDLYISSSSNNLILSYTGEGSNRFLTISSSPLQINKEYEGRLVIDVPNRTITNVLNGEERSFVIGATPDNNPRFSNIGGSSARFEGLIDVSITDLGDPSNSRTLWII